MHHKGVSNLGPRTVRKPKSPFPHPKVEATMQDPQHRNHEEMGKTLEHIPGREAPQAEGLKVESQRVV